MALHGLQTRWLAPCYSPSVGAWKLCSNLQRHPHWLAMIQPTSCHAFNQQASLEAWDGNRTDLVCCSPGGFPGPSQLNAQQLLISWRQQFLSAWQACSEEAAALGRALAPHLTPETRSHWDNTLLRVGANFQMLRIWEFHFLVLNAPTGFMIQWQLNVTWISCFKKVLVCVCVLEAAGRGLLWKLLPKSSQN